MYKDLTKIEVVDDAPVCDLFMDAVGRACVTAIDEAGIFSELAQCAQSSQSLGSSLGRDPRAIDAVFRVLVATKFLDIHEGAYSLTPLARAYFDQNSPLYRGYQFYSNRKSWEHQRVLKMIETGWDPIAQNDQSFTDMWEQGTLSQEAANRFTGMMHTNISGPAIAIAHSGIFNGFKHIVDAGGGSGIFLAAMKQINPEMKLTLLELPQVIEAAKRIIKSYVDPDSIHYIACNFFKDSWEKGADAYYMSNILHDWPYEKGDVLLAKAFDALPKNGSIFINECLLNEDRISPKHTVVFDLMMYMNHQAQQYTQLELEEALRRAGFQNPRPVFNFGYYTVIRADKD